MNDIQIPTKEVVVTVGKTYETPQLIELGNVAELTNYDVSTMVP